MNLKARWERLIAWIRRLDVFNVVMLTLCIAVALVILWVMSNPAVFGGTASAPRYFALYDAAFDECMASDKYSRAECIIVAQAMNQR